MRGRGVHSSRHAVDSSADDQLVFLGLEVNVRGVLLDRPLQGLVDEFDRRSAVSRLAHIGELGLGDSAGLGLDLRAVRIVASVAVGPGNACVDVRGPGDRELDSGAGRELDHVEGHVVGRVGERDENRATAQELDRQRSMLRRIALRQQPDGGWVRRRGTEVQVLQSVLGRERAGERFLVDHAETHDGLPEPLVRLALFAQGSCELLIRDQPVADEDVSQALAAVEPAAGAEQSAAGSLLTGSAPGFWRVSHDPESIGERRGKPSGGGRRLGRRLAPCRKAVAARPISVVSRGRVLRGGTRR